MNVSDKQSIRMSEEFTIKRMNEPTERGNGILDLVHIEIMELDERRYIVRRFWGVIFDTLLDRKRLE